MFLDFVLFFLAFLLLASGALVFIGPSMSDRLLGLNLMSSKLIMMIVVYGMKVQKSYFLDIALVFSLLGFIGIVFIGNFILKKGRI